MLPRHCRRLGALHTTHKLYKGPLGQLGLADEPHDLLVARCAYIYCIYTIRATSLRLLKERKRLIEGHCAGVCAILKSIRAAPMDWEFANAPGSDTDRGRQADGALDAPSAAEAPPGIHSTAASGPMGICMPLPAYAASAPTNASDMPWATGMLGAETD